MYIHYWLQQKLDSQQFDGWEDSSFKGFEKECFVFVEQNGYNLFSILSFNTVGTKQNVLVKYLFWFGGHSYFSQM